MNEKKILLILLSSLLSANLSSEISISANLFLGRSFSANIAREMIMTGPNNQLSNGNTNGFFAIDGAYQRMWNQSENQGIGAYPFWSEFNTMTVGNNNGNYNIDAYQFGLGPVSTNNSITLNPVIYQDGSDFMFYVRGKQYGWSPFAKIKSALTAMVVNPGLTESNSLIPVIYPAGALSPLNGIAPTIDNPETTLNPANSITQAFAGIMGGQTAQGDFKPMQHGLINGKQSTGAHLSDTEITLGYNYSCQETDNTISFGLRITAPTGNKPNSIYILEPINGRGGYWGVGGYLAGTYEFWHNESKIDTLQLNFMSSGIHLCGTSVIRSYDLTANGHGSKYLLVADYQDNIYQQSIQNLVNLSTLESKSSFAFEGDAALAITYHHKGFSLDLGYNVWGRTGENLIITQHVENQRYAILGRQGLSNGTTGANTTLCQPTATISQSLPNATTTNGEIVDATIPTNRISGIDAFNTTITAQYAAVTSKLFGKIGYNWKNSDCCPYLNLMGECEWSNISNNALPQWSLALIVGVSL